MLASTSDQQQSEHDSRCALGRGVWRAASGRAAVSATVRAICGSGAVMSAATAEGLALSGRRAARLPSRAPASPELRGRAAWVLHAVRSDTHAPGGFGAFELVAGSLQEAVDHCLVAQCLAARIGKAGICSIEAELADELGRYRALDVELAVPLLEIHGGSAGIAQAARNAFEDAATATGRPLGVIDPYRVDGAIFLIIAVGTARVLARRVVDVLRERGFPFGCVGVALLRPFPAAALASLLRDRRAAVMTSRALDHSEVTAGVLTALGTAGGSHVPAVAHVLADPSSVLASIAEVFELRAEAGAPLPEVPKASGVVVAAAPAGALADALLLEIAAAVASDRELALWRPRALDGLCLLGIGTTRRDDPDPIDVLIGATPQHLPPSPALAAMREGGSVLVGARADSADWLAGQLSAAQRELCVSRKLRITCFDDTRSEPPAADAEWSEACRSSIAAAARVVAERLGLAADREPAAGDDERSQLVDLAELANPAPSRLEPGETGALPVMPDPAPESDARWITALHRFHVTARAAAGFDALLPLAPAAIKSFAARSDAAGKYPLLLSEGADGLEVVPLRTVVEQALSDLAQLGERVSTIEPYLDRFVALAAVALRGLGARPVRPLLDTVCDQFAAAFSAGDATRESLDAELAMLRAALPDTGQLLGLGPHTHVELYAAIVRAEHRRRSSQRAADLRMLIRRLGDLLDSDSMKAPAATSSPAFAAGLGGIASALLDIDALVTRLTPPRGPARLSAARRCRIEQTLETLRRHVAEPTSAPELYIVHPGLVPEALELGNTYRIRHEGALGVAAGLFDGLAAEAAQLVRAVRMAELELAGAYDPARHDEALLRLDWEAFTEDELRSLTPVVVIESCERVWSRSLDEMSALLRSGRPVHVLIEEQPLKSAVDGPAALGYLLVAHREAVVVQSTLAQPQHLARGFSRMARALRPAACVIAMLPGPGPVPAWIRLSAAHEGRALPCFRYDPDAGQSWAECFEIDANSDPEQSWPQQLLAHATPLGERPLEIGLTFADAVALEADQRHHFQVIPPEAWSDDQIELASWLSEPSSVPAELPFIWVVDDDKLARAIVSRALAFACRERLRMWRIVQELGGAANEHARRAALAARAEMLEEVRAERRALQVLHAKELERVRSDTVAEAMQRLARALLDLASPSDPTAPLQSADTLVRRRSADNPPWQAPPGVPFIDTLRCTSCNECRRINPELFQYNADKQAFIADPRAGTFVELVTAAEACPVRCIHPGKPRSDDPTVTDDLLARGARFD